MPIKTIALIATFAFMLIPVFISQLHPLGGIAQPALCPQINAFEFSPVRLGMIMIGSSGALRQLRDVQRRDVQDLGPALQVRIDVYERVMP